MLEVIENRDYNLPALMNEELQTLYHKAYPEIFKPYDKEDITNFFKTTLEKENTHAFVPQKMGEHKDMFCYSLSILKIILSNIPENIFYSTK